MQTMYSSLKVNNEIELCEIEDGDCRKFVEKELLQNRISYFIRWPKKKIFSRKSTCIICVHDDVGESAAEIIQGICDNLGCAVKFLFKKSKNDFL